MRRLLWCAPMLLLLVLPACSGGGARQPAAGDALAPTLVVERFLRASNAVTEMSQVNSSNPSQMAGEIETMAKLFGTREGSVLQLYPREEVEKRMFVLARVLHNKDYRVNGERAVPGRGDNAVEVVVDLTTAERPRSVVVPFIVVRSKDGWLIERIDIEKITSS